MKLFNMLTRNGWKYIGRVGNDADEPSIYEMDILSRSYNVHCIAKIAEDVSQLGCCGHYGVLWIECTYECDAPYSVSDLQDMITGIEFAEDNLLRIGVPFGEDRKFMGRNAGNKKRRNIALRKKYGFPKAEEKWERG